ncbi:hypothetical protein PUN28_010137 [Cardiocondyla obscurior]|uniref:Odorant receptor n=1 Tax=Cardiocondyla obscurior TaxID=286306 RepID=A0AAW2FM86_9HYME
MFANKYYERDVENAFAMNRFFFRLVGLWPLQPVDSFIPNAVESIVMAITCFAFVVGELTPTALYTAIKITDVRLRLKAAGSVIFAVVGLIKYSYMLFNKSQVRNCLMLIDKDWQNVINSDERILMIDQVRFSKRLIMICVVFVYMTGVFVRMLLPFYTGKIVTPDNVTIRPLPVVAYLVIVDVQRSPFYEIVFFVQFFGGFFKYTLTVAVFSFMTVCAMHFCAQSNVLVTLMNDLVNESRPEYVNKKLAIIVEHQIKTRNFLQLVQYVTQYPSLIEVLGSTVMLCFAVYYITTEWEDHNFLRMFTFIIALAMFTFDLFIYCYMGEQVISQEEKVSLTACTLEWHHLPSAKARALILLIIISEHPLKLRAGNFIDLSLRTFSDVVKMAVTYFNLIRSTVN